MACFCPLDAYQFRTLQYNTEKGTYSRPVVFNIRDASDHIPIRLPCGRCTGCRLQRAAGWAARCLHEASIWPDNCFITLTYSDHHMPSDRSLQVDHFQRFMKRLRKRFVGSGEYTNPDTGEVSRPIRFYHCGEYGERLGRPHYHALLFNFDFPDKKLWRRTKQGHHVWRSQSLEELWPFGFCEIGSVTYESAAYVARYIMKKFLGGKDDELEKHYMYVDPATGVISIRKPEYTTMSRRPGIAYQWFRQFKDDVYPHDHVIIGNRAYKPPRYYDNLLGDLDGFAYDDLKESRWIKAQEHFDALEQSNARLYVKEQVAQARLSNLPRSLK